MPKDLHAVAPARPVVVATAMQPLDFMLALLRDETASLADRKWAAERAAPYCHPRAAGKAEETAIRHEDALEALA